MHHAKISKAYSHPLQSKHPDVSQVTSGNLSPLSQVLSLSSGPKWKDALNEYGVTIPQPVVNNSSISNSRSGSNSSSQRTSLISSIWEDEGFLILQFGKRPLGFGIMSPLNAGTMVSSITDESLKKK